MKAQSIRRLLTLTNVVLALGVVGAAGWWFAKARPAMAGDPKRVAWVVPANEAYQTDANNARKADFWQVYEKDFDHIVRPDLMDTKKNATAPGVWPFVGPRPPKVGRREPRSSWAITTRCFRLAPSRACASRGSSPAAPASST